MSNNQILNLDITPLVDKLNVSYAAVKIGAKKALAVSMNTIHGKSIAFVSKFDTVNTFGVDATVNDYGDITNAIVTISGSDIAGAYIDPSNPDNNFLLNTTETVANTYFDDVATALKEALNV